MGILFFDYPLFWGGIYQDICDAEWWRDPAERKRRVILKRESRELTKEQSDAI
jgi:hypothetical protein